MGFTHEQKDTIYKKGIERKKANSGIQALEIANANGVDARRINNGSCFNCCNTM